MPLPDFTSFHPGYEEEKKKEAERRKTLFRNHRSLAGCGTHPLRARTPSGVLARGTHASQRLSFGPGFAGQAPKVTGFTPSSAGPVYSDAPRVPVIVPAG